MAAKTARVSLTGGTWTKLSDGAVSAFSFQNLGPYDCVLAGTTADSAPSSEDDWPRYSVGAGERNVSAGDLFPGVGSSLYIWALTATGGSAWISHA